MAGALKIAGNSDAAELSLYVDNKWRPASSGKSFAVRNPATGDLLAMVPDADPIDTREAIDAAARAFAGWAKLPAKQRATFLVKIQDLILQQKESLARLLAMEEGKPIVEARFEVQYAADFLRFFSEECTRDGGEVIPYHEPDKRIFTIKQPVGVAGLITIWNYPLAGVTRSMAPALAAGCTVVVKPPEQTPLSAIALFELMEKVDMPRGVANLITTARPEIVGREMLSNPLVRKVSFTGSIEVGRKIMHGAADQLKRITLELGGHAPLLIFEDADIDAAAQGALRSKFQNMGQTCVSVNRIYVHRSVEERFTQRFIELVGGLKMGNPLDETVQIGPLISAEGLAKVRDHVAEAVELGARTLVGGSIRSDGLFAKGFYFEPTVLTGVRPEMRLMQEETFGPVAPIITFESEGEVLSLANDSPYGLAAFFYTREISRVLRVTEALEYGVVGVNNCRLGAVQIPFGGFKQSGYGKEGGRLGLEEFLQTKLISIGL